MNNDNYKQKMTKYDNGKIYKIESDLGDLIYIGSTTKERLSSRLAQHVYVYRNKPKDGVPKKGKSPNYTSTILFDKYGVENCKIILIENYSCKSKDELTAREAHYIQTMQCVNKNSPAKFDWDKYYDKHKEELKARSKSWRINNLEHVKKQSGEKIECACGSKFRRAELSVHLKTKKHLNFIPASSQIQQMTHSEDPLSDNDISEDQNNIIP